MQRSIASVAALALCTGWMVVTSHPAAAQGQPPTQQPPTQKIAPAANVSEQQLDKTAAAIESLRPIRSDYAQKLSTASPDEKDKVASEAYAAMQKAVTDQGLSVDEYNSIIRLAQNDPGVRAKIEQRLGAAEK